MDSLVQTDAADHVGESSPEKSRPSTSLGNIHDTTANTDIALEDDFFYSLDIFKDQDINPHKIIDSGSIRLFHYFGFSSHKRNNIHFLDEETLFSSIGNVLVFYNLKNGEQKYMMGLRKGSIGAIAVHPMKTYFAVAEVFESQPHIYVFEYPSLKLYRILRGGAERGYSDICFNSSGDKIASVATDPDYMLTIWDWKHEKIVLRSKAFSQDVYRVSFSPDNDGILTTSGMGHIKFWRMASTFTGLKLQGYLGKFGETELSDISAFIQLPDGKVLSSTETGNMLLWDGGMIKCEIGLKGRRLCHQGRIEVILLVDGEIITAGEDGMVRIWDLETIDNADVSSGLSSTAGAATDNPKATGTMVQSRVFEIEPIDEILITKDVKIRAMVRYPNSANEYLVHDLEGNLFRLDLDKRLSDRLISFHSGPVVSVDTSPTTHTMASFGGDGTLRIYEYNTKRMLNKCKYPAGGSSMRFLPMILDCTGNTLIAGFTDGVVRIISYTRGNMVLQHVFKPHREAVSTIAISSDGKLIVTGSKDKSIFLFQVTSSGVQGQATPYSRSTVKVAAIGGLTLPGAVDKVEIAPDKELLREHHKDDPESTLFPKDGNTIVGKRLLILLTDGSLYSAILTPTMTVDSLITFELSAVQMQLTQWKLIAPNVPVLAKEVKAGPTGPTQPNSVSTATQVINETIPPSSNGQPNLNSNDGPTSHITQSGTPQSSQLEQHKQPAAQNVKPNGANLVLYKSRGIATRDESSITAINYLQEGYFIMSIMNTDGEAELRLCHILIPTQSRLLFVHKSAISELRLSQSSDFILIGSVDGTCSILRYNFASYIFERHRRNHETYLEYSNEFDSRIKDALDHRAKKADTGDIVDLSSPLDVCGQFWLGHGHDLLYGKVNAVQMGHDGSFLLTAGEDGGIFSWRIESVDITVKKAVEANLEEQANLILQPEDIVDRATYTIQESKIRSEKDRETKQAEIKKQAVRNYIQDLRNEFVKIVGENEKQLDGKSVNRTELCVDPYLKSDIEQDTLEKSVMLHKKMAWGSEKAERFVTKLRETYLDPLQTERIEFQAFETGRVISTFRTRKLNYGPETISQQLLATAERENAVSKAKYISESCTLELLHGPEHGLSTDMNPLSSKQYASPTSPQRHTRKHVEAKSKMELRKQLRAEREVLLNDLMAEKPIETYEDPKDIASINYARLHMGDYRLKTADNYIVPDNERIDTDKKKRQILHLRENIHLLKEQYNKQVLKLRARKELLIARFANSNNRIDEINVELVKLGEKSGFNKKEYIIEPSAFTETRYIVTSEDIAQLQKDELKAAMLHRGQDNALGDFRAVFTSPATNNRGLSALNNAHSRTNGIPTKMLVSDETKSATSIDNGDSPSNPAKLQGSSDVQESDNSNDAEILSPLELEMICIKKAKFQYEESDIKKSIEKSIKEFDSEVDRLSRERLNLEEDLKFADIKLLLLHQEWILLKEFETYDTELAEKLVLKQHEKDEIDQKISECQERMAAKKAGIEAITVANSEILEEFLRLLGENNINEDYLMRVFKRKIKRSKKKAKNGENGMNDDKSSAEEEDEESDNSLGSSYGSDIESDDEEFEEKCPVGCDHALWSHILEQREKRLEQDELLADIQKSVEIFKKEHDSFIKKERVIGISLKVAEDEIQDFQTQKQRKLNELDVVVPLKFHQIQHLERNMIPSDLSVTLVFVNAGLSKFYNRISELKQERVDIKRQHKELRKQHVGFIKNKREKEKNLQELSDRARNVQLLKFGKVVDLEKLERLGVNKTADELREKLQREGIRRLKEEQKYISKLDHLKERLTEVTKENTIKLETLVQLKEQRCHLEDTLNTSQSSVNVEYSGPNKKDIVERNKLIQLVQSQSQKIDALKHEIEQLIRKSMGATTTVRSKPSIPRPPSKRRIDNGRSFDRFQVSIAPISVTDGGEADPQIHGIKILTTTI
ncbi:hypothetical protein BASA50_001166 [Batrachochytrium salamandrivorans]|uniref:EML-like first beta-propeller domain-containing protein n=1 Tax=Batrachochytrium salamandrivorans TaxID=1357716 RepID=A0ABQ8EUD9_9FUNG|nr:hypothetical protein BASA50_001166 [Batrachochytrium salamandrivorans]KAH9248851.1 hypothetical protein BASA81_013461 [Batrachochytrium salamandrivorans]